MIVIFNGDKTIDETYKYDREIHSKEYGIYNSIMGKYAHLMLTTIRIADINEEQLFLDTIKYNLDIFVYGETMEDIKKKLCL